MDMCVCYKNIDRNFRNTLARKHGYEKQEDGPLGHMGDDGEGDDGRHRAVILNVIEI